LFDRKTKFFGIKPGAETWGRGGSVASTATRPAPIAPVPALGGHLRNLLAQLVLQAGVLGLSGEIFLLDMRQPVRILDLARDLIALSVLPSIQNIESCFTGLARSGTRSCWYRQRGWTTPCTR